MMAAILITLLMLTSLHVTAASRLHGWDCTRLTDASQIDLRDVGACNPPTPAAAPTAKYGAVIQQVQTRRVPVLQCRASYIQYMYRCNYNSHISAPVGSVTTGVQQISRDDCLQASRFGTIKIHDTLVDGLKINSTHKANIYVAGSATTDGTCYGAAEYTLNRVKYNKVVVEREYSITITEHIAILDVQTGYITTLSRIVAPFQDLHIRDAEEGDYYWNPLPAKTSCQDTDFATIYKGKIDIIRRETTVTVSDFAVVQATIHLFALKLQENSTACGLPVRATEHPRLFVIFLEPGEPSPFHYNENPMADLLTYINSKFLYSELRVTDRNLNMSADVITRRCEVHRATLLTQLQSMKQQPELVGHLFHDDGLIGRAVGEILYLARCTHIPLSVRRTESCFDALPVTDAENRTLFLAPISRQILQTAEPVPCDGPFPPCFELNGTWYRFDPLPKPIAPPKQLQPDASTSLSITVLDFISTAGLYTPSEMEKFSKFLAFPSSRSAITNTIGRAMTGEDMTSHTLYPENMFSMDHAAAIVKSGFKKIWGWFYVIGQFVTSCVGILYVIKLLRFFIKTAFNAMALHEARGCSLAVLAAVWTSATHWVIRRHERRQEKSQVGQQAPSAPPLQDPEAVTPLIFYGRNATSADNRETRVVNSCPVQ